MTSFLDSEAQFLQRASELGIPDNVVGSIKRQGLATLNSFGFSFGQPGQAIDSDAFASFFEGLVGPGQTLKTMAAAKNLLFESHVFITASLKNRVENTTESIKPVPLAERSARLDKLRAKYKGLNIIKALEPGHSLLDATSHQAESKTLRYIPPSRCASREPEIVANKDRLAKTLEVEGGALKIETHLTSLSLWITPPNSWCTKPCVEEA